MPPKLRSFGALPAFLFSRAFLYAHAALPPARAVWIGASHGPLCSCVWPRGQPGPCREPMSPSGAVLCLRSPCRISGLAAVRCRLRAGPWAFFSVPAWVACVTDSAARPEGFHPLLQITEAPPGSEGAGFPGQPKPESARGPG